jgi:hypothetical protein
MRGSMHDKGIREFMIDQDGMHVLGRFMNVTGILAGTPVHLSPADIERAWMDHDSRMGRRESKKPAPERRAGSERRKPG